jgi:cell division septal protein FtsQ
MERVGPDPQTLVRRASRDLAGRAREGRAVPRGAPAVPRPAWGDIRKAAAALAERVARFLALIALLCGGASFAGSSTFDIQSVTVTGNEAVADSDVVAASGLQRDMSVFGVNTVRVRERLRRDPRIADASVTVVFPGSVRLAVQEQPAVAALRTPSGYVLVTSDGVVLAGAPTPRGLPVLMIDRLDPAAIEAGAWVPSTGARVAAGVAASLPSALRPDVAIVRVDGAGEIVLLMRDGIAVKAGGADGVQQRIARAGDVLAAVRARGLRVEYVDLRFPDSVIVKPLPSNPAPNAAVSNSLPSNPGKRSPGRRR